MDFGYNLPTRGPAATRDGLTRLARKADDLGYAYLAVPDHIVFPRSIDSEYPYDATGRFPGDGSGAFLEQLTQIAFLAAVTEKVRFVTSVMVVPHRPAVLTAKILATIDVLSEGRLTVGCGVGWMREEFEALDAPPFDARGKVTDEYIAAFRELWTQDEPVLDGDYVKMSGALFFPKPVQKPGPPIWTGGESPAAMRRAARLADGWYPIGSNPRFPLDTADRLAAGIATVKSLAEEAGRDPAEIDLGYWANWYRPGATRQTDNGERMLFTGSDADVIDDIGRLRDLGVRHLLFHLVAGDTEQALDHIDRFTTEVRDKAGG